jgi:hypothetical protein
VKTIEMFTMIGVQQQIGWALGGTLSMYTTLGRTEVGGQRHSPTAPERKHGQIISMSNLADRHLFDYI